MVPDEMMELAEDYASHVIQEAQLALVFVDGRTLLPEVRVRRAGLLADHAEPGHRLQLGEPRPVRHRLPAQPGARGELR